MELDYLSLDCMVDFMVDCVVDYIVTRVGLEDVQSEGGASSESRQFLILSLSLFDFRLLKNKFASFRFVVIVISVFLPGIISISISISIGISSIVSSVPTSNLPPHRLSTTDLQLTHLTSVDYQLLANLPTIKY